MRIVALTFHDVVADMDDGGDPFYRIGVADLEKLLAQLRKLGYQSVSSRDFRAWQLGQKTLPERAVVLTFDRENLGSADPTAEAAALLDASSEIDGYLAGRYSLPLATVPPNLILFCCDIAIYRGSKGSMVTEECRKRFEDAIRYLSKVAEGKISLFASDPSAPNGGSGASFTGSERVFTRTKMRDM